MRRLPHGGHVENFLLPGERKISKVADRGVSQFAETRNAFEKRHGGESSRTQREEYLLEIVVRLLQRQRIV